MRFQEACDVLEDLLDRDAKNNILSTREFNALNRVLFECQIKLGHQVEDERSD